MINTSRRHLIDDEEDDEGGEVPDSEIENYKLVIINTSDNMDDWYMANGEGENITKHYRRTITKNPDLIRNVEFWDNSSYCMSRCELNIRHDVAAGKTKTGYGKGEKTKGENRWYARRLRAINTAVEHTREGISSKLHYVDIDSKKSKKMDEDLDKQNTPKSNRGKNHTPHTDKMRQAYPKRKLSGSDEEEGDTDSKELERIKTKEATEKLEYTHAFYAKEHITLSMNAPQNSNATSTAAWRITITWICKALNLTRESKPDTVS